MKKLSVFFAIALIMVLVACNLASNIQPPTATSPDAAFTQAAQTVAAELTHIAESASPTSNIPTNTPLPTNTVPPPATNTPIPSPTKTQIPCLMVGFNNATIDQTVPDNTVMAPGQTFVKTWRLINMGSCTWNSSYQLIFDHGDSMGVPNTYAQTMTAGSVGYFQTVDVSVSLVAPNATGTYTGYWRFKDPNGILFGIGGTGAWIVKIKVINSTSVTLAPVASLSGSLTAAAGPDPAFTVGESSADNTKMTELFLNYDISGIPTNATIVEVKTDLQDYTTSGNPFSLGVLNGYVANYGTTLEIADFVTGFPSGNVVDWGSTNALNKIEAQAALKTAVQSALSKGRFQLRLQFPGSNNNGTTDSLTFAHPGLIITYVLP